MVGERHIVIFEDEEDLIDLCRLILEPKYIISGYSGEDDLELEQMRNADLFLVDLWLKRMQGEEIIQTIRNDPFLRHIPLIIFSAKSNITEIADMLHVDGIIKKPFTSAELIAVVESAMVS